MVIKTLDPDPHPDPQSEKMLDPDPYPDPHKINPDPQPCLQVGFGEEVAMAAGAAVRPEVVVGASVRVQAAPGAEHL